MGSWYRHEFPEKLCSRFLTHSLIRASSLSTSAPVFFSFLFWTIVTREIGGQHLKKEAKKNSEISLCMDLEVLILYARIHL